MTPAQAGCPHDRLHSPTTTSSHAAARKAKATNGGMHASAGPVSSASGAVQPEPLTYHGSVDRGRRARRWAKEAPSSLKDRALDAAAEGITIADARRPDLPLVFANSGFERLTGYRVEDVLGQNCRFLQGEATDPAALGQLRRALAERRECTVELLNYRKDRTTFWNRLSITPVRDEAGEVTHFIGIQSDVTSRRQTEEELRASNRRMQSDLEAAARVQRTLLPSNVPAVAGLRLAWRFVPSVELAGDGLDVLVVDGHGVAFHVLDVSGHGVASALLSFTLHHWLSHGPGHPRGSDGRLACPGEVVGRLNRSFPMNLRTSKYFTIVYCTLDLERRVLRWTTAGHLPPVLVRRTEAPRVLELGGPPVGMLDRAEFPVHELTLEPDDRVVLLTDGVTDALTAEGVELGLDGLLGVLDATREATLDEALDAVVAAGRPAGREAGPVDDLTLLGFELGWD